jgi:hypothetical protein
LLLKGKGNPSFCRVTNEAQSWQLHVDDADAKKSLGNVSKAIGRLREGQGVEMTPV